MLTNMRTDFLCQLKKNAAEDVNFSVSFVFFYIWQTDYYYVVVLVRPGSC